MGLTPEQIETVRVWAARRRPIERVWLFGSRVKGTAGPDSDLDVAVTVEATPGKSQRETCESMGMAWLGWQFDLSKALGLEVDLHLHEGELTPDTSQGVSDAGVLVFDRPATDAMLQELYDLHAEIEAAPLRGDGDG